MPPSDNFSMPYTTSPVTASSGDYAFGIIRSPKIDEKGEPHQKSIRDIQMARDVVRTVIMAGRNRQIVNSRILAKYNAERPYDSHKLESEGLGWKQNFTTKPLPNMIEKVAPRFSIAVDGLKYFTNSSLSDKWLNNTEKTEKFRKIITETIRGRKGWKTLIEDIAFNNALFGHSVIAWLDEFSWFPKHFQQDESFLSDGTKQTVSYSQVAVLKEVFMPHELFDQIKDMEAAKMVGWNIQETIDSINRASPVQIRDRLNGGGTLETWYQNALRELTIGASYMAGMSVIVVYSLIVQEVTGKVSHYRMAGPELLAIFEKDDRFERMDDCLAFFAYQKGNGTMHGSKGVGRDIYELAGMIDRTRNEIVDRSILSGKQMVQGDVKRIHQFKMSIVGATVIVPSGWDFLQHKIDGNIEPFLKLDAYFSQLVDQLIGNTSPPTTQSGEGMRSPAAWNLLASREEEGKDVKINRFLEQFVEMVGTMQRRICDVDTSDKDAKEAQRQLLLSMTRDEIDELANDTVAGTIRDLTPQERQLIVAIAGEKKGNPLYNQRALEVEDLTARVGADFAEKVLMPANDPTEEAENHRQQQFESALLSLGQPVPVSPRDNHLIHLSVVMPTAENMGHALMQGGTNTQAFETILAHINEHYNQALGQGVPKEKLKEVAELMKQAGPAIAKLKAIDQQAQQLQAASAQHDAEHPMNSMQPSASPGQPPMPVPPAPPAPMPNQTAQ